MKEIYIWKQVYQDPTAHKVKEVFSELQQSDDTESLVSIAIFILSHGGENGEIFSSEGSYCVDEIIQYLIKCKGLAGKPKLMFVQACRGDNKDHGIKVRYNSKSETALEVFATDSKIVKEDAIPCYADILIFQASYKGHVAIRNTASGSWFIQELCKGIDERHIILHTTIIIFTHANFHLFHFYLLFLSS